MDKINILNQCSGIGHPRAEAIAKVTAENNAKISSVLISCKRIKMLQSHPISFIDFQENYTQE